ncbi:MAG TPA: class I SAM-dependent methyltransferase [Caulobacteraceae bacterium]|nr:class I SAM-dependent methyltransferase [Caulobacteraceae bacterium]
MTRPPASAADAAHDAATLAFYDREAGVYAARPQAAHSPRLERFLDALAPGAAILELGCGGGRDAEAMLRRGFDVTPTDGSPGLAAQAEARLGRPVRLLRFEDLDADAAYDAVWANACLLHAPFEALPGILARIRRALKPGGRCFASFKAGEGPDRDALGRYYNFPTEASLRAAYDAAGPWTGFEIEHGRGGGFDGVERDWLMCLAVR